jgi:hypothetical protein
MPKNTCAKPASEALLVAAALLLVASPVAADYRDSYRSGIEAAGRESWADAERFMRAALAEHRYYLGLALYHSGNCLAARREWESARAVIAGTPFMKTVGRLNRECQKRAPREAAASRSAPAVEIGIRKAEKLASAVSVLETNPAITGDEREALQKDLREARERLADARVRLDGGRRDADLGDIAKAREMTERATADIEKARRRAMSHLDPLAAARPGAAVPESRVSAPLPPVLVNAVRAYFEGRYEDVVQTLGDVADEADPAALQAHLFRAAARHALYVLGGGQDESLRRAVTADVEQVRRIDPAFHPDAAAFSPRFRQLFEQARP